MRDKLIGWYLEWVNHYMTVDAFAEHHGISRDQALIVIKMGRDLHQENIRLRQSLVGIRV